MLEILWDKVVEAHDKKEGVKPYELELICMLERTLNFSQTGSTKVIVKSLMEECGLGLGLVNDGMPVLWNGVSRNSRNEIYLCPSFWPTHSRTNRPLIASARSMELNYSLLHAEVSGIITNTCVATQAFLI